MPDKSSFRSVDASAPEDRIGGLFMRGFDGTSASDVAGDLTARCAGFVLFARNLADPPQTANLIAELQARASAAGARPLLVGIDQEGGSVSRLRAFGTSFPSAMALGAAGNTKITHDVYRCAGDEMDALGVTIDFAPVADVNDDPANPVIGTRSFGDDPALVAEHVTAAIRGLHDAGIAATAKHFPGHGSTNVDSHRDLPVIDKDIAALRLRDLVPFRAAIEAGVDAVMVGHIGLPRIDPSGAPATLSAIAIRILREELGFTGMICSDCMQMAAVAGRLDPGRAVVAAIEAGVDLLVYSSADAFVREAMEALRVAVATGRIPAARIVGSLERVERLRTRSRARERHDAAAVGSDDHRRAMDAVAKDAVTLVRDPQSIVPFTATADEKIFVVQFVEADVLAQPHTGKLSTPFAKRLASGKARVLEQLRSLDPAGHEFKQMLMAAAGGDLVVAVARNARRHRLQAQAIADLALAGKPLVVIAAIDPYDATLAPADAAAIATFGDDDAALAVAADIVLGTRRASGKLPISLTGSAAPAPVVP